MMTFTLLVSVLMLGSPFQQSISRFATNLSGVVVVDGGGALPLFSTPIYVFAASSDKDTFVIQEDRTIRVHGHGAAARVGADGTFKLRLGDGLYSVKVVTGLGRKLPDGYSVKSIVVDNRDVLKQKLQVPVPEGKSLRITITTK